MQKPRSTETALYVRLPATASAKLDRAAEALRMHKKDLVAGLVARYVDPDSPQGLSELGALTEPRRSDERVTGGATLGAYSFQPYDLPEVMSADQAAQLLQIDVALVVELAEAGTLPGRKLGTAWRFSRAALVAWLATPEPR